MRALTLIMEASLTTEHSASPTLKGVLGTVAAIGSTGVSFIEQVKPWLQLASLVVGILVGIATLISVALNLIQRLTPILFKIIQRLKHSNDL